ncbi:reverse transcriptase [Hirsutella rhossiliensis]|uniref:Reverse transcriptase n=1 Tax=Hirsutella rhossiliensis TaxID=111463 RepID=A0A9P8MPG4_9HYPO|nr:reverse transcriptase [Hirsutella rhossiliensis]KAH0959027.1 reverse transcriptase [Hirsutella rhossiliensis]
MQDRSARIRYQDIVTDSSPSSAGRFGYADDTAILCLLSWGAANGISFDPDKTEVMHFSRTKPKTAPPVLHGDSLSFKTHVEKWTAKAQAVAFHLRRLTNTKHGLCRVLCDEPSALASSPCYCTRRRPALDEAHPLVQRTSRPKAPVVTVNKLIKLKYQKQPQPFRTRLRRADEMLSSCPRPALLQRGFAEEQTAPLQSASKHETAKKFRDWLQALSPRTLVVYSDGSRSEEGHIGYGYAVHRDGSTVLSGKGRLGTAEVFDAEAKGALEGLKAAVSLPETDRIFVCLDNLATATCLRGTPNDSSQEVFLEFQSLAGASLPEPADGEPTLAHLRKIARLQRKEAFSAWWETSAPERYRDLRLKATTSCLVTTMRD